MIIRLRARAHLNAEKTSFQSQRAFNVKELPTSKSYRRQIASNVKELPMSKSFRRQKASDAKELCNNKFRRWLGGGGGMWSCFVSPLHCRSVVLSALGEYRWRHTSSICLFLHALSYFIPAFKIQTAITIFLLSRFQRIFFFVTRHTTRG